MTTARLAIVLLVVLAVAAAVEVGAPAKDAKPKNGTAAPAKGAKPEPKKTDAPAKNATATPPKKDDAKKQNVTAAPPAAKNNATKEQQPPKKEEPKKKGGVSEHSKGELDKVERSDPLAGTGNVKIARTLQTREVITGNLLAANLTVRGSLDVGESLNAKIVKAKTVATDMLVTSAIKSESGTVMINGDVMILSHDDRPATEAKATSFVAEKVVLGGVHQWRLVRHDDFEQGAEGWSLLETSSCSGMDHFLGGHCKLGNGEVTKVFDKLPPHKQVRVTARYHMIDNWQHETAFLKLGEHYSWVHRAQPSAHGIEMCGNEAYPEAHMSLPVDVVQAHEDAFLQVTFGSKGAEGQDPCERSFGVDDVQVWVR